jgi:hypothetical protein
MYLAYQEHQLERNESKGYVEKTGDQYFFKDNVTN